MTGRVALALLFGSAVVVGGRAAARRLDPLRPPIALGVCVSLALIVIVAVDIASVAGFRPWWLVTSWGVLAAAGIRDRRKTGRETTHRVRLAIVACAGLMAALPLILLPVPLDTDAQGFGHLALAIRVGGTLNTLSPWQPGIAYVYAPGALVLFATVSAFTTASMAAVMLAISHATIVLFVWLAWELGEELERHRPNADDGLPASVWPRVTALSACLSVGLWAALLDSHETAMLAQFFILGFIVALLRFVRTGAGWDLGAVTVTLAAVPLTHSDSAAIVGLALVAFVLTAAFGRHQLPRRRWLTAAVVAPAGALLLAGPWLASLRPLLETGIRSPYDASLAHVRILVLFHGVLWPVLAVLGGVWSWRRRVWWGPATAVWIAAIGVVSVVPLASILPPPLAAVARFNYPFSLAWHGPIVPYLVLGAAALVEIGRRTGWVALPAPGWRSLLVVGTVAALAVVVPGRTLSLSRPLVHVYGAFSSHNDVRAMRWIRDHAPRDTHVLNYPGDYEHDGDWEAHWAPVITERDCVYFRMQPFFLDAGPLGLAQGDAANRNVAAARARQLGLLAFWRDPAPAGQAALLDRWHIDYVLVPESIGDPASLTEAWRWKPPSRLPDVRSTPDRAPYLRLVYQAGGARVYAAGASDAPGARP